MELQDVVFQAAGMPPESAVPPAGTVESGVKREAPEPHEARRQLVERLTRDVKKSKAHWQRRFDRAKADTRFVLGLQWEGGVSLFDEDRYIANIALRHVQQRVAALYAKNPRAVASRKKRLEFALWDGKPETVQMAIQASQAAMMAGMPPQPEVTALLADIAQGMEKKALDDRVARSLEIVYDHYVKNQAVPFKKSMKKLVRRVVTVGWGWLKLDFQRDYGPSPDKVARQGVLQDRLAQIEALLADLQDGERAESDAEAEQLRLSLEQLQKEPDILVKEGLQLSFPSPVSIIPHWKCTDLHGFLGAPLVAEEYRLTPQEVKEIYKVDVSSSHAAYNPNSGLSHKTTESTRPNVGGAAQEASDRTECLVWDVYVPADGLVFTICDGYPDVLKEPEAPNIQLERFYPWFPLTFNDCESDEEIFPLSDVSLIRPMQKEYNRARDGLRRHRIANRPKTIVAGGMLVEDDKDKLKHHPANAVIELQGLAPGQKVDELLQAYKGAPIDPGLYDTAHVFEDILRVAGAQEANMGGTAGATATESSIAENSRMSGLASNIDDLDDFLTEVAQSSGQVLFLELSQEEAVRIAGPGASWPQMTRQEIASEITLEIQAGSSGRPNQQREIANMERLAPFMLQVPGVSPRWMLLQLVQRLDDRMDIEDAFAEGMPSIMALNSMMTKLGAAGGAGAVTPNGGGASQTGDARTAPGQQGAQGAQNADAAPSPGGLPIADAAMPQGAGPGMGAGGISIN